MQFIATLFIMEVLNLQLVEIDRLRTVQSLLPGHRKKVMVTVVLSLDLVCLWALKQDIKAVKRVSIKLSKMSLFSMDLFPCSQFTVFGGRK